MAVRLYHSGVSTCSQKVRLALALKAVEWDGVLLDLMAGDTRKPDYLALNPAGVVPTLEHDGRVIRESSIINEYVEEAFDGPVLLPRAPADRADARLWIKRVDDAVYVACGVLTYATAIRSLLPDPVAASEPMTRSIADPAARAMRRALLEQGMDAPAFGPGLAQWTGFLAELDRRLADRPWIAGDAVSLAECAAAPYALRYRQMALPEGTLPHLAGWLDRVSALRAFAKAVDAWPLPPPLAAALARAGAAVAVRLQG